MTVSLIISTYNWPRALYLCLDSVMQQTAMPTEILIADDGSGISTRDVVRHFEAVSPVPIRHIWHEDKGFRLAMIRNKAIAASRCEYIIQIDGDLILQRNFIQDHMIFAQRGCYVTGSRGIITEMLTRKVLSGEITSLTPLMRGVRNSNNVIRIPLMAFLYRTLGPTRFVKGCNMAFWRNDLIRVNGYDESLLRLGTRRFRTGDPPRQQRRAPAVHEVSRRGLPPPPWQMRAQQPLGQRGTLPANHP